MIFVGKDETHRRMEVTNSFSYYLIIGVLPSWTKSWNIFEVFMFEFFEKHFVFMFLLVDTGIIRPSLFCGSPVPFRIQVKIRKIICILFGYFILSFCGNTLYIRFTLCWICNICVVFWEIVLEQLKILDFKLFCYAFPSYPIELFI